jgi:serine/threonine protein kinase
MFHQLPQRSLKDYGNEEEIIGKGSYGTVSLYETESPIDKRTKFAIKQFYNFESAPSSIIREISGMLSIPPGPYVMPLIDVVTNGSSVHLVMPSGVGSLRDIRSHRGTPAHYKQYLYQMTNSLAQIHQYDVWHRDIKPDNYIIFEDSLGSAPLDIVISDFGICRTQTCFDPSYRYTNEVYTLWYRAPEILLGETKRDLPADVWALACTFYEMLHGKALFPGDSEIDQLFKIFRKLGTPNSDYYKSLPEYQPLFPQWKGQNPSEWLLDAKSPHYDPLLLDLLTQMLEYDPKKRITAFEMLSHPYFADIDQSSSPPVENWFCDQSMEVTALVPDPKSAKGNRDAAITFFIKLLKTERSEVLFLTIYLFDKYCETKPPTQKAFLISIFLASQFLDRDAVELDPDVSTKDVLDFLKVIGWYMNVATPFDFFQNLIRIMKEEPRFQAVDFDQLSDEGRKILSYLAFDRELYFKKPQELGDAIFEYLMNQRSSSESIGDLKKHSSDLSPLAQEIDTYLTEKKSYYRNLIGGSPIKKSVRKSAQEQAAEDACIVM